MTNICNSKLLLWILLFISTITNGQPQPGSYNFPPGPHKTGFKLIRSTLKNGKPVLISAWYPTENKGADLSLADVLTMENVNNAARDTSRISLFIARVTQLFDRTFSSGDVMKILNQPTGVPFEGRIKPGQFPVILQQSPPSVFFETNVNLASYGLVVYSSTTELPESNTDSLLYQYQTNVMEELLNFVLLDPAIDKSKIYAFGFGGSIQSAIYLAMRRPEIRKIVNIDGGFFSPRSKSTLSIDYHPEKLKTPLLHITTSSLRNEEDSNQLSRLSSPMLLTSIVSPHVRHHDFTSWGRIALKAGLREEQTLIGKTVAAVQRLLIGYFLDQPLKPEAPYLSEVTKRN